MGGGLYRIRRTDPLVFIVPRIRKDSYLGRPSRDVPLRAVFEFANHSKQYGERDRDNADHWGRRSDQVLYLYGALALPCRLWFGQCRVCRTRSRFSVLKHSIWPLERGKWAVFSCSACWQRGPDGDLRGWEYTFMPDGCFGHDETRNLLAKTESGSCAEDVPTGVKRWKTIRRPMTTKRQLLHLSQNLNTLVLAHLQLLQVPGCGMSLSCVRSFARYVFTLKRWMKPVVQSSTDTFAIV